MPAAKYRLRVIVLGTTEAVVDAVEAWQLYHDVVGIISMSTRARPDNSVSLQSFAAEHAIPYFEFDDLNEALSVQTLGALQLDVIFSMWPKLLSSSVISLARCAAIGSHPTPLPENRGRHPLHWMVAKGVQSSALSFFRLDAGVDTGEIYLQIPFDIAGRDIAACLQIVRGAVRAGLEILAERLAEDAHLVSLPQDERRANYWRKRTIHDTLIDLRMSADAIDRLVRSYCKPFPCAKLLWQQHMVPINAAEVIREQQADSISDQWRRLEPGRILGKDATSIMVRADDLLIRLTPLERSDLNLLPDRGCVHPPSAYIALGGKCL